MPSSAIAAARIFRSVEQNLYKIIRILDTSSGSTALFPYAIIASLSLEDN